jgi:putative ABC transport system ATP-binding protein
MYKFMENENGGGQAVESAAAGEALISMRGIWKTYQMGTEELHALRGVSFEVKKGEYLAIIGPSGRVNRL